MLRGYDLSGTGRRWCPWQQVSVLPYPASPWMDPELEFLLPEIAISVLRPPLYKHLLHAVSAMGVIVLLRNI